MLSSFLGFLPILTPPLCALALSCDQEDTFCYNKIAIQKSYVLTYACTRVGTNSKTQSTVLLALVGSYGTVTSYISV
jgi:hypothetical protein